MGFFQTLDADFKKLFALLPIFSGIAAIADPTAAPEIAAVTTAVEALKPAADALQAAHVAAGNPAMDSVQLTQALTTAVTASSAGLTKLGVMSATTNDHVQALAPAINAAVQLSALSSPPVPTPPAAPATN